MRLRAAFVLFALTIAAALPAAEQLPKAQSDAELKEINAYRLTMEGVNKVAVATRAMATELKKDPKFQEMMKLGAEITALEKKDELTDVENEKLDHLKARKEELSDAFDDGSLSDSKTLSDMAANIEKFPPLVNGLRAAGMTPREYATFMMAMIQASMAAGLKKSGMIKELPKEVSAENVKFIEEYEKELQAIQKELSALNPRRN